MTETARTTSAEKSGAGRPRASARPASGDPRADIVAAAAQLFRRKGVAGASVREIAAAAGLRKASLYYYFPSKKDIVHAMIEDVLRPALVLQKQLGAADLSEAARLHLYLRLDVEQLCAAPYDCTWLIAQGDPADETLTGYWRERDRLIRWLAARVKKGQAAGDFVSCDPMVTAKTLLAATEGASGWADRRTPRKVAQQADALADLLLRGLLADPARLADIKANGRKLYPGN